LYEQLQFSCQIFIYFRFTINYRFSFLAKQSHQQFLGYFNLDRFFVTYFCC